MHSPADLERDNPNLVGGDSLGGSHHLDQNFFFRPAFGWSRYRTPIERLYMVGASTWPGAGTGAGSGFMLAKALAGSSSHLVIAGSQRILAEVPDDKPATKQSTFATAWAASPRSQ